MSSGVSQRLCTLGLPFGYSTISAIAQCPVKVDTRIQIPTVELIDGFGMRRGDIAESHVLPHDRAVFLVSTRPLSPLRYARDLVCSIRSLSSSLTTVWLITESKFSAWERWGNEANFTESFGRGKAGWALTSAELFFAAREHAAAMFADSFISRLARHLRVNQQTSNEIKLDDKEANDMAFRVANVG